MKRVRAAISVYLGEDTLMLLCRSLQTTNARQNWWSHRDSQWNLTHKILQPALGKPEHKEPKELHEKSGLGNNSAMLSNRNLSVSSWWFVVRRYFHCTCIGRSGLLQGPSWLGPEFVWHVFHGVLHTTGHQGPALASPLQGNVQDSSPTSSCHSVIQANPSAFNSCRFPTNSVHPDTFQHTWDEADDSQSVLQLVSRSLITQGSHEYEVT